MADTFDSSINVFISLKSGNAVIPAPLGSLRSSGTIEHGIPHREIGSLAVMGPVILLPAIDQRLDIDMGCSAPRYHHP